MSFLSQPDSREARGAHLATLATILAAYLATFLSTERVFALADASALVALGILFALIGTLGFDRVARRESLPLTWLYLIAQIILALSIVAASRAASFMGLIVLPLASHAVLILSRRMMLSVCALILVSQIAIYGWIGGWSAVTQAGIGYLAGVVFVVVFTQVALNEASARGQVELLAGELNDANRKLREYATQVEELAIAKERNRLAREIHDGLGHYLTAINIQIEAARAVMNQDHDRAQDALDKAQTLARDGLNDVRRSVAALRAAPIESRPLRDALAALVEEFRASGSAIELRASGAPRALTPQVELTLYRAAQEGLTNIRKHARASRATVALDYHDARVELVVQDDGVGATDTDHGFGLLGLRERVHLLGGQVRARSEPGQGFALQVELPV